MLDAGCGVGLRHGDAGQRRARTRSSGWTWLTTRSRVPVTQLGEDVELLRADIRDLPFESESFDVVVCFEVIEHVERQADALAELKRVLRPDGTLLISSPNRDVYTPGNPHHVHEYLPEELQAELQASFRHVVLYRQHPWLASAVLPDDASSAEELGRVLAARTGEALEPGKETYTIAVASDVPPVGARRRGGPEPRLRGALVARAARSRPPGTASNRTRGAVAEAGGSVS